MKTKANSKLKGLPTNLPCIFKDMISGEDDKRLKRLLKLAPKDQKIGKRHTVKD